MNNVKSVYHKKIRDGIGSRKVFCRFAGRTVAPVGRTVAADIDNGPGVHYNKVLPEPEK